MRVNINEQKELKKIKCEVSEKLQKNSAFKKLQLKKKRSY